MCVDALDKSQLPTSYLHVDTMKRDGNYYSDVKFASMEQSEFNQFLKLNAAFGEIYKNNYFFYECPRVHSRVICPTSYHKNNYPSASAREAICKGKMLVVSPTVAIQSHLQTHYHTNVVNGIIILTESSPETSPIPSKELVFDEIINNDENDNDKHVKKRNINHFNNDDDDDDDVDDDDDDNRNSTRTHGRVVHKSHAHEDDCDVEEEMDFPRKRSCSLEWDGDTSSGPSVPQRNSRSDHREDESIRKYKLAHEILSNIRVKRITSTSLPMTNIPTSSMCTPTPTPPLLIQQSAIISSIVNEVQPTMPTTRLNIRQRSSEKKNKKIRLSK